MPKEQKEKEHTYVVELTSDQLLTLGLFYAHGIQYAGLAMDTTLEVISDARKPESDILKIAKMLKAHVLTAQEENKSGTH